MALAGSTRQSFATLTPVEEAVVDAVCYADVFDWPLTPAEVHAFLPLAAEAVDVDLALRSPRLRPFVVLAGGFVTLAGREPLAARRRALARSSAELWPRALRSARAIGRLPFVRLVGVTGSLAAGAAGPDADVDLFVVTEDRRLWLTRAATIAVGRAAAATGVRLCPNYLLAESALELPERDAFTAHELARLVPIAGAGTHERLLASNAWYRDFLPNHRPATTRKTAVGNRPAERLLRAGPFDRLEAWEMVRKVRRLGAGIASGEERYGPAVCKGHVEGHRARALAAYEARLAATLGEEAAA